MKITKTLIVIFIFIFQTMKSQTSGSYITSNIQQVLENKTWSIKTGGKKISFSFKDNGKLILYIDNTKIGTENYYVTTNSDCGSNSVTFDNSKIGTKSSGNYIKTVRECYIIEFFSDYQKFRLKREFSSKWQVYSLD